MARDATPPILITGADRSGTTLLFGMFGSHPDITMVRRTNLWRWFDGRHGPLTTKEAVRGLIDDLSRYPRLDGLEPDWTLIERRALAMNPPTYGAVFRWLFEDHASRRGTGGWGDKSLHLEHRADRIFSEWPDAKIVHVIRDPRDRHASVSRRYGGRAKRISSITGRWISSVAAGERNVAAHPGRYVLIRYEDVASDPEVAAKELCSILGLPFDPAMLTLGAMRDEVDHSGNSSFAPIPQGAISTASIGRFGERLTPQEIATVEALCRGQMLRHGYVPSHASMSAGDRLRWLVGSLPREALRTAAWRSRASRVVAGGEPIPDGRLRDQPAAR